MITLDTNILVRLLVKDDIRQFKRVVEFFRRVETDHKKCFVSDIVLCEFVLVLENIKSASEAQNFADKVIALLSEPMAIEGLFLTIDVSIGISLCPQNATTSTDLIHQADMAMYAAKKAGRNAI